MKLLLRITLISSAFLLLVISSFAQLPSRLSLRVESGIAPMLGGAVDYYFTPHLGVTTGFGGHLRHVQQYQDGERIDAFLRKTTLMVPITVVGNWSLSPKSRILVEMGGLLPEPKAAVNMTLP